MENVQISYSSPGKVILSGEHSVVYGQRALCAAIQLRTKVTVAQNHENDLIIIKQLDTEIRISPADLNQKFMAIDDPKDVFIAILMKLREILQKLQGLIITITSDIPIEAGLGSSASLALSLTAALYHYTFGCEIDRLQLLTLAKEVENIFHGQSGSGLDVTISSTGGLLSYQKDQGFESIKQDTLDREITLLLIDTGMKKLNGTSQVVESVRVKILDLNAIKEDSGTQLIKSIGYLTNQLSDCLTSEVFDYNQLFAIVGENQSVLDSLGVGTKESKEVVDICENLFIACKITGAGQGGFCLAFVPNKEEKLQKLQKELMMKNYQNFVVQISAQGTHIIN